MSKRSWFIAALLLIAGVALLLSVRSFSAPPPAISGVTVVASCQEYNGPCPAKLTFTATVTVTPPMSFNFQWERSDGAKSKLKVMHVPAGHPPTVNIVEEWQLGSKGKQETVSEKIRVRSGNVDLTSAPATVVVNCK